MKSEKINKVPPIFFYLLVLLYFSSPQAPKNVNDSWFIEF